MDWLLVSLPSLGCAAMMVGMMWFMSRSMQGNGRRPQGDGGPPDGHEAQLRELRREVEQLRAQVPEPAAEPDRA